MNDSISFLLSLRRRTLSGAVSVGANRNRHHAAAANVNESRGLPGTDPLDQF